MAMSPAGLAAHLRATGGQSGADPDFGAMDAIGSAAPPPAPDAKPAVGGGAFSAQGGVARPGSRLAALLSSFAVPPAAPPKPAPSRAPVPVPAFVRARKATKACDRAYIPLGYDFRYHGVYGRGYYKDAGAGGSAAGARHLAVRTPEEIEKAAAERKERELEKQLDEDVGASHQDSLESTFTDYDPCYVKSDFGFVRHPDLVNETSSLSSVESPKTTTKLCLPTRTLLEGHLTSLQIESILFAVSQHNLRLPDGKRAGFFMGDGAGVGKGRQLAGIMYENHLRGRKKALWFSISSDLVLDARRDLADIGAKHIKCHNLKAFRPMDKLHKLPNLDEGVLFSTYSLLVSGVKGGRSRLDQIVEWCGGDSFDGCIALDECHRAKNMGGLSLKKKKDGKPDGSKAAQCVAALQDRLPLARVVYVSATGASEPQHMALFARLGLWGKGTSFPHVTNFLKEVKHGGVGAMELVAMHMKAQGQYLSRNLSFKGATFEIVEQELPESFIKMYDAASDLWASIIFSINRTDSKKAKSLLWGYNQRFWGQMVMASKIEPCAALAQKALSEGKCVVIGLQSTGDAGMNQVENDDDDCLSSSARHILVSYIEKWMVDLISEREYDVLLEKALALDLPMNPLDDLLQRLGGKTKVAEMTGRSLRLIKHNGKWESERRLKSKNNPDAINIQERKHFQTGRKLVAIISEAASTGISLQADKRVANQRRRVHITLQLPWSADKAVQQMGRSHRSNQSSAPEFKLLMTNIGGEWRFASAVSKRLQSLGALTQGDRRANGGAQQMGAYSIESKYGLEALKALDYCFFTDFYNPTLPNGVSLTSFLPEGYPGTFREWVQKAAEAMCAAGLQGKQQSFRRENQAHPVDRLKRFLNRLLGMKIEIQNQIFAFFTALLQRNVMNAKRDNKYSEGIVDIAAEHISIAEETTLYKCARTTAETSYVRISSDRGVGFEKAVEMFNEILAHDLAHGAKKANGTPKFKDHSGFYQGRRDPESFVLALKKQTVGLGSGFYHVVRPNTGHSVQETHISDIERIYAKVRPEQARKRWEHLYTHHKTRCGHVNCPYEECTFKKRMNSTHVIAGLVLPFWKIIQDSCYEADGIKVVRVNASEKRIVGILVKSEYINQVKDTLSKGLLLADDNQVHAENLQVDAFFEPVRTITVLDCLNPAGIDTFVFDLENGWSEGGVLTMHARIVEIPYQNAARPDQTLVEAAWRMPGQLVVNGQAAQVPIPRLNQKVDAMHPAPACLDQYVHTGANIITVHSYGERFSLVVQIGRKKTVEQVAESIEQTQTNDAEEGVAFINEMIAGMNDDDLSCEEIEVSLRCPLGFARIATPCKGRLCEHFQCFDLNTFLTYGRQHNEWSCPFSGCGKMLHPRELVVDALFGQVLRGAKEDAETCKMNRDGEFTEISTTPATKGKAPRRPEEPAAGGAGGGGAGLHGEALSFGGQPADMLTDESSGIQRLIASGLWELSAEAEASFVPPPEEETLSDEFSDLMAVTSDDGGGSTSFVEDSEGEEDADASPLGAGSSSGKGPDPASVGKRKRPAKTASKPPPPNKRLAPGAPRSSRASRARVSYVEKDSDSEAEEVGGGSEAEEGGGGGGPSSSSSSRKLSTQPSVALPGKQRRRALDSSESEGDWGGPVRKKGGRAGRAGGKQKKVWEAVSEASGSDEDDFED